jgi:hypothetical protein
VLDPNQAKARASGLFFWWEGNFVQNALEPPQKLIAPCYFCVTQTIIQS